MLTEDDSRRERLLQQLAEPFPPELIKQRQGGGGSFRYVEGETVIRRLNQVAESWDFQVVGQPFIMQKLDYLDREGKPSQEDRWAVVGTLTIPGLGARSGIGVQNMRPNSGEDMFKGLLTDCVKKCATLFGVALDLYDDAGPAQAGQQPGRAQTMGGDSAPATEKQIKFLETLIKQAGYDLDLAQDAIVEQYGLDSYSRLPKSLASQLIEEIKGSGSLGVMGYEGAPEMGEQRPARPATIDQARARQLQGLAQAHGWLARTDGGRGASYLRQWMEARGLERLSELRPGDAQALEAAINGHDYPGRPTADDDALAAFDRLLGE